MFSGSFMVIVVLVAFASHGQTTDAALDEDMTCGNISVTLNMTWNATYENRATQLFKDFSSSVNKSIYDLFNDSSKYTAVELSELVFKGKAGETGVNVTFTLCLVQNKSHEDSIEKVFEDEIKTGKLFSIPVFTGSFKLKTTDVSGQGNTTITIPVSTSTPSPSPTPSSSLSQSATLRATSTTPTLSNTNFISQTSTPTSPTATPTPPTATPTSPTSTPTSPTSKSVGASSQSSVTMNPPTTPPSSQNWTCLNLSMVIKQPWNISYTGKSSQEFQSRIKSEIEVLFKDTSKYGKLELLGQLKLKEKDENIDMTVKLCIEVKKDDADSSVIDVLNTLNKNGKLDKWDVKEDSVTFKEIGVKLGEWKFQECSKCSEGGVGPYVLKRDCTSPKPQSCNGLKTKESKDCVEYCNSCAAAAISSFTLIMGIILSFSFNIWK